jgi:tight adherence protein B
VINLIIFIANTERRELNNRLSRYVKEDKDEKRYKISWKRLLTIISKFFAAGNSSKKIEKDLIRAGIPLKGEEFQTLDILLGIISWILIFIVSKNIIIAFIISIIFLMIPRIILNIKIKSRLKSLENQISDTLTSMANSMRAGFSFLQAMEMVAKEMPEPISGEFKKMLREIGLGTPTQKAMLDMSERIGSDDLDLVVTVILIQRQVGGNLAEVLDNISETIRERMRINGEVKTLTAQGRISGLIISILPAALGIILFIINKDYIMTLFTHRIGIIMLIIGIFSQIFGYVLIRKVIQIDV